MLPAEQIYRTVDIERRGYGRRYTWLPVDTLTNTELVIDCAGAYVTPEMIDIRPEDVVRWRDGKRWVEGRIGEVQRDGALLRAQIEDAHPLPPETFFP
jgi:hypothetical protein